MKQILIYAVVLIVGYYIGTKYPSLLSGVTSAV